MATTTFPGLRILSVGLVLSACGGTSVTNEGSGAATGTGATGSGGSVSGNGGSGAGGSGDTGGTGTGGSAGDDACAPMPCANNDECVPVTVPNELITDFSGLDDVIFHSSSSTWWLEFFGGAYVYPGVDACTAPMPATVLTQDLSAESHHVAGTVGTWSGFGLWFAPCVVDLSEYSGLSFTISGDAGLSGRLGMVVHTASSSMPSTDPRTPTCSPNVANCVPDDPARPGDSCRASITFFTDIGPDPRTVTIPFSEFTDGLPNDTPDTTEVLGINFQFDWSDERTEADWYPVDVVLDDVKVVR